MSWRKITVPEELDTLYTYDIAGNTWTICPGALPMPSGSAVESWEAKLWALVARRSLAVALSSTIILTTG
jgi:hypothetical protein